MAEPSGCVIVGAGPSGACLALHLARQGVPVTLVETTLSPGGRFRGEALMPHGLEVLAAMELLPLPAPIPQRPLQGWRYVVNGHDWFRLSEPLESGVGHPCTLISQPALLQHLLSELEGFAHVSLLLEQSAETLLWQGDRIAGVRLNDGRELPARVVVAADGRGSRLRQQAGLALERLGHGFDLLWFQLQQADPGPLAGEFVTLIGPAGICSAFASASGTVQVGWVQPQGKQQGLDWAEQLAAQSPCDLAPWWRQQAETFQAPIRWRVQVGHARRWWRPGLLLLGDAAHPMSPVRAQGINLALRDAWVAGCELGTLLREQTPNTALDAALARIEAQRRPEISRLQRHQAAETVKGLLLLRQPQLRRLAAASAPWLGALVAQRWRHEQRPFRQGISTLTGLKGCGPAAVATRPRALPPQ
jgi:2-polyprenyl-6-methoxyphenol hydroxylase-like FAD-dependent oxidoreductase